MEKVTEGSIAIAEAVKLARPAVISGYPITPQTHIIEELSLFCSNGSLDAKYIPVESEHSAMAAVVAASCCGVRTFTASSSHGLAYMHEMLHWAAASRLPIVLGGVNRALGPGWNIWTDQSDTLSQRDTGWIQLYCEDAQEALDTTLLAYRLAELVNLPVMVIIDAFLISHTYEAISIPSQEEVDTFLPLFIPRIKVSVDTPFSLNQMMPPSHFMEARRSIEYGMERAEELYESVEREYFSVMGREYGAVEAVDPEEAETILVTSGSAVSTCRLAVAELRRRGEKVGLLKMKRFRPFPARQVVESLRGAKNVCVIDRNFSFGVGGIFAQEIKAAMCNLERKPKIFSFIAGLGGRDITQEGIEEIYLSMKNGSPSQTKSEWVGLNEEVLSSC